MNRNDRAITGLVMLAHSLVHTYEFVFPVFIPLWLSQFGTTEAIVGAIVGIGLSLFGLGAPLAGVLTDRRGSKPLILACLFGMGGSFVLLGLSSTIAGLIGISQLSMSGIAIPTELGVVTIALIVWGVSASLYHPAGLSLITRGVEARGSAFAYHGTAGNIGTALGPLLATILLFFLSNNWRVVALILAVPALIGVAYAVRINVNETAAVSTATDGGTNETESGISSLSEFFSLSKTLLASAFLVVFSIVMFSGLYYRGVLTFLPSLLGDIGIIAPIEFYGRTIEPANYLYTGLLATGVGGQYVGGKLTDRIPVELGLTVGYAAFGVVALAFLPITALGLIPFVLLLALLGFVLFFVQPFYQATVADYTPASVRGLSYGYTYLGVFGIGALGTPLAGAALTYLSLPYLFGLLAVIGGAAAGLSLYLLTAERNR
ncbi:MFS transporter [Halocatena marina]|uniref:MFS transporter n=1 Tax=Halocatena marina TaxID=2934937 RepID=A0ABD5YQF1_9EURY|nr:MFS transporter [Halocatena marina]